MTDDELITRLLNASHIIAVVGLSPKPERPSFGVARYLIDHGYEVIPVNPGQKEILGRPCYASLPEVPQAVDIVVCFRNAADIPPIARDAVAIGAKALWMQLDIVSDEGAAIARAGGLAVVMDRCIKIEHARRARSPQAITSA